MPCLTYRERCWPLHLDPLCLRHVKLDLSFLPELLRSAAPTARNHIRFANDCFYPLRNRSLSFGVPNSKVSFRSNIFTVVYCTLWYRLPDHVRSWKSYIIQDFLVQIFQRILNYQLNWDEYQHRPSFRRPPGALVQLLGLMFPSSNQPWIGWCL